MSEEKTIAINKNTMISIGLAITLFGAVVFNEVRFANLVSDLKYHINRPDIHENGFANINTRIGGFEEKYITRKELELKLEKMDLTLQQIQDQLRKGR